MHENKTNILMSLQIVKASAGSGKTYKLTKEYIRLILTNPSRDAYRHVLAVTFTNKATDEMKRRILRELHTLATDPGRSPYLTDFVPGLFSSKEEMSSKAAQQLRAILHDYSSFAVSTIDKFYLQTLRAFAHEIGQFAACQVELDRDSLVEDTVERVLGNLAEGNRELLDWIIRGVNAELRRTGKFNLDRKLAEMTSNLINLPRQARLMEHQELENLEGVCGDVIASFTMNVRNAAENICTAMSMAGLDPADTSRGFIKAALSYMNVSEKELINMPTAFFLATAQDPQRWYPKTKAFLTGTAATALVEPLGVFCALFEAPYKEYATAWSLRSQVYALGMAEELRRTFTEVQKERGVISIDDTNEILHGIIDGSDCPFIYEKLGVRFDDFLLDEFQDTSTVQWDNFRPLLANGLGAGRDSLVVGDVKQSIYRWRGSDCGLLANEVQKEFPDNRVSVLDGNWRTCREIVRFNNDLFSCLARAMDRLSDTDPAAKGSVTDIYGDVNQKACTSNPAPGSVEVKFVDDAEKELEEILLGIEGVIADGAGYGDIAVLVRGNAEGAAIAEYLIGRNIPVMSDEALYIKNSATVRRIVSQLSVIDNPALAGEGNVAGYLAREMGLSVPKHYHGLVDLCEEIVCQLREADSQTCERESAYIQAFMDWTQDWTDRNGNILSGLLRDWKEAEPKIASPQSASAVRIMTVHKSKGLEFPYVIFPFAEKVSVYKPSSYWCRPDVKGTVLEEVALGQYNVSLSDESDNTLFSDNYKTERRQQAIDNINVLYVALTRAQYGLKIIAVKPPLAVVKAFEAGESIPAKNLSHLLYSFVGGGDYFTGERFDFRSLPAKSKEEGALETGYACSQESIRTRVVLHTSGAKFFGKTVPTDSGDDSENVEPDNN